MKCFSNRSTLAEPLQQQKVVELMDHHQKRSRPVSHPQPPVVTQSSTSSDGHHVDVPRSGDAPAKEPRAREAFPESNTPRPPLRHIPATESNGTSTKRGTSRR